MDLDDLKNLDLSDIDFNNMGSWPPVAKGVVAGLVFAIVAFLVYNFFISDQIAQLERKTREEINLKKDFEQKQSKAVNLEAYKNQMETIRKSFETLLQQLPKSSEMAGLLDDLSYAATGAGCELLGADFADEQKKDIYTQKDIKVQVSGGYHQIADFISRVSRLPRIVTIHDFKIEVGDGTVPSSPGEKLLIMTATARTYRADTEE